MRQISFAPKATAVSTHWSVERVEGLKEEAGMHFGTFEVLRRPYVGRFENLAMIPELLDEERLTKARRGMAKENARVLNAAIGFLGEQLELMVGRGQEMPVVISAAKLRAVQPSP